MTKRRTLRLRDSQHLGCIGLGELARFKHLIEGIGQAQFRLTLGGVGKPEIREHVSGAASDGFSSFSVLPCHNAPHDPARRLSIVQRRDRHPVSPSGYRTATSSVTRGGRTLPSRTEPYTRPDTRFRRATRRSPARQDRGPSTASSSARYRRTARCRGRCPCPL